uniref:Uncharacterized protein n=1 Tax=Davidia involucrata TaxID=16924 RepID=A0A5B6YT72_DAVIN
MADEERQDRSSQIERELKCLLKMDDSDEFIHFLGMQLATEEEEKFFYSILRLPELLEWVFYYGAEKCARALLEGGARQIVDLNIPLKDGSLPLHRVAEYLDYNLTMLFLEGGARTDLKCNVVGHKFYGMLPVNVAVELLSHHIEWTPKQSVVKLVLTLYQPELRKPLDTIRLLATSTDDIEEVAYHYAEAGKLIELAALLKVAREKILPLSMYDDYYSPGKTMTLRHHVAAEIVSLTDQEYRLMGSNGSKWVQACKEKKKVMMSVMLLLEIFERAIYDMEDYYVGYFKTEMLAPLTEGIALILKDKGFALKDAEACNLEDDCEKYSGRLKEYKSQPKNLCLPFYEKPSFLTQTTPSRMPVVQQRLCSMCSLQNKSGLSSGVQSFNSLSTSKDSFSPELCTRVEAQVKRTTKSIEQHVPNFLSSRKLSILALAIKRGIRHL